MRTMVAVLGLLGVVGVCAGRTISVDDDAPADFATIQAAIDDANDDDEIVVRIGTYYEKIRFKGKNIILRSTEPKNPAVVGGTIIDGRWNGSVVSFSGSESTRCVLSGFTITNGLAPMDTNHVQGGGICGNGTLAVIQNNVIRGNLALPPVWPGGGFGGGIHDCDGLIQYNIITHNEVWAGMADGGGGGLSHCDGTIQNNIIAFNKADGTGGGGLAECTGNIRNNTIFGNSAEYAGGLISCSGTIVNCIVWGNTTRRGETQLYACAAPSYCCIEAWTDGTGNISEDPMLANPQREDFHLLPGSPCIDSGLLIPVVARDFEGDLRRDGASHDMGADEFISGNRIPERPTNISPADGETDLPLTPTLRASAFSDPDAGHIHWASQWHVWASDTGRTAWSLTQTGEDLTSIVVPSEVLSDDFAYDWCVRYQDDFGRWSDWSEHTHFVTEYVGATIQVPEDFGTIQGAIDASSDGDAIVVSPGRFVENLRFKGKNIVLRSTAPEDPCVVAATVIDGNAADAVVIFEGTESSTCVLAGFTITNGIGSYRAYGMERYAPGRYGGGIFGHYSPATIRNNVIIANKANVGGGLAACRGLIERNAIAENAAYGSYGGYGGGLDMCDGTIRDNLIKDNRADESGGGLAGCDGTIQGNRILRNSANDWGGGLIGCNGTVTGNIIRDNRAYHGGGLADCVGKISNNIIDRNFASKYGGGLVRIRGAILENNIIFGNSAARDGGGLHYYEDNGTVIRNCTLWANTAGSSHSQLRYSDIPEFCCIENWSSRDNGNINADPFFADADRGDYHLKSQAGRYDPNSQTWVLDDVTSPCIDAGDPMNLIGLEPFPNGGIINMGAYGGTNEASKSWFGEPPCEAIVAGDVNGDCIVDFKDFQIMALHWMEDR